MINTKMQQKLIALEVKKRALKQLSTEVQKEIDQINNKLVEQYAEEGIQSMQIDGFSLYLRSLTDYRINADEAASLKGTDLEFLLQPRVNQISLSAYIREQSEKYGEDYIDNLPSSVKQHIRNKIVVTNISDTDVSAYVSSLTPRPFPTESQPENAL